jgi:hypothetical protein
VTSFTDKTNNGAPLEIFKLTRGQKYLFRVIGTGALYPWRISVDQHNQFRTVHLLVDVHTVFCDVGSDDGAPW